MDTHKIPKTPKTPKAIRRVARQHTHHSEGFPPDWDGALIRREREREEAEMAAKVRRRRRKGDVVGSMGRSARVVEGLTPFTPAGRTSTAVARSIPAIEAKYAELLDLYGQGEINEEQYLRLKGNLVRKGKKAGIGRKLAQMERQAAKGRRRGSRLRAADRRDHEDAPAVSQWQDEAWFFEQAMQDENFEAAEDALEGMEIARSQMSNNRPNAYEKEARRRLIRARTYPRKTPKLRSSEVRKLYSQQLTDDASGWAPSERVPDDPFTDFMYPEGADEWFARKNPRKLSKKEANAKMRARYGANWYEREDAKRERDSLIESGTTLRFDHSTLREVKPKKKKKAAAKKRAAPKRRATGRSYTAQETSDHWKRTGPFYHLPGPPLMRGGVFVDTPQTEWKVSWPNNVDGPLVFDSPEAAEAWVRGQVRKKKAAKNPRKEARAKMRARYGPGWRDMKGAQRERDSLIGSSGSRAVTLKWRASPEEPYEEEARHGNLTFKLGEHAGYEFNEWGMEVFRGGKLVDFYYGHTLPDDVDPPSEAELKQWAADWAAGR